MGGTASGCREMRLIATHSHLHLSRLRMIVNYAWQEEA
ncbi:hypothetical protein X907_2765 [Glycocaulis alkaliphilus]|uniref:Uncharacterized protein n=1 Tax=Glycocaulis alkaliphilus TaxID=1434191 RepID=A0A3T0EDB2_9PROT|nr:hypothetical protein X907_2765 [Glycocaulis alkaliphilus]